jgi:hypothetical protein
MPAIEFFMVNIRNGNTNLWSNLTTSQSHNKRWVPFPLRFKPYIEGLNFGERIKLARFQRRAAWSDREKRMVFDKTPLGGIFKDRRTSKPGL